MTGVFPGNFRFVDRQKTLAVAGDRALENDEIVEKLRAENFHVLGLTRYSWARMKAVEIPWSFDEERAESIWAAGAQEKFYEMIDEIEKLHKTGKKVLVTCGAGISTSPTVAAAYLVLKRKMPIEKAIKSVATEKYARQIVRNYLNRFAKNSPGLWKQPQVTSGGKLRKWFGALGKLGRRLWRG